MPGAHTEVGLFATDRSKQAASRCNHLFIPGDLLSFLGVQGTELEAGSLLQLVHVTSHLGYLVPVPMHIPCIQSESISVRRVAENSINGEVLHLGNVLGFQDIRDIIVATKWCDLTLVHSIDDGLHLVNERLAVGHADDTESERNGE